MADFFMKTMNCLIQTYLKILEDIIKCHYILYFMYLLIYLCTETLVKVPHLNFRSILGLLDIGNFQNS
jgi:hypothetical protein